MSVGLLAYAQSPKADATYADVERIFKAHCLRCHTGASAAGGLGLESHSALMKGGASGPAVVPKDPKRSLLMVRLHGDGGLPRMPMGFTALSAREVKVVADWIDAGAKPSGKATVHWAYVPPARPSLPNVKNDKWARNPIDRFVLARLEAAGLRPSPEADRATLLRRVSLDLQGMLPDPAEVDAFVADSSPDAYERRVDAMLKNSAYGEKMALPWLDAARYADSNGFQQDGDTYQWVWRDWVVKALNENMPFDRFTILQLAGDLLPGVDQSTTKGREALIATAFNRNHMLNGEGGAIPEEQRNVAVFDRVDTTSTVWLGLTMTCARCHDHKYDPISQKDYFGLMAYFNKVPEIGVPQGGVPYSLAPPWIYTGSEHDMRRLFELNAKSASLKHQVAAVESDPETIARRSSWESSGGSESPPEIQELLKLSTRDAGQSERLRSYFLADVLKSAAWIEKSKVDRELQDMRARLPKVMVMSDRQPRVTRLLNRGNYQEPLDPVSPAVPSMFGSETPIRNRLELARWVVDPKNPLTARVQVNRAWQTFFGQGLVKTPENFGVQSEPPSHPELLDWLATEYVRTGWDTKRLHRMIVTSATYRQSSKVTATLLKRDPGNELLARGARFRMPSMILRDIALQASGLLNPTRGGKPVYPYQPAGIWDSLAITKERDFSYPQSKGADLYRKSLYTFWRRTVAPGNMFDAASRQVCTVREARTSTPLHALTMLNDPTWVEAGRGLAERAMKDLKEPTARLQRMFCVVCSRKPGSSELAVLRRSLDSALAFYRAQPGAAAAFLKVGERAPEPKFESSELAAYASVGLSILNLDEAMTRE